MFKKGLVTLVCLIVMSAVWSWATATYTVSTEINSLGTKLTAPGVYEPVVGGTVKLRTAAGVDAEGTPYAAGTYITHTAGIKSITPIETRKVEVQIDAADNFKIASVTKTTVLPDGSTATTNVVTAAENLRTKLVTVDGPTVPNRTQKFLVTFAALTTEDVIRKTWQLQATNNNGGGSFTVTRAGADTEWTTISKPLIKNYVDTTSVTVTATPKNSGYKIDYVVINGVKDQTDRDTFTMTVNGSQRLNTFNFGYKKLSIPVTTTTLQKRDAAGALMFVRDSFGVNQPVLDDLGILPINPVADPYGTVRLIVAPVGAKNVVRSISVIYADDSAVYPAANIVLTDRFGDPVTLPYTGAVKVTIKGLTEAIKVSASYGFDATATAAAQNCTNTCHLDTASVPATVRTAAAEWAASPHASQSYYALDCVYCHKTMPGPEVTATTCTGCHKGAYGPVLSLQHAAGKSCLACHNQHSTEATVTCATCHTAPTTLNAAHTAATTCVTCHADTHKPSVTSAKCASCHGVKTLAELAVDPYNSEIATRFDASKHATSSARGGSCAACHSHEGYVARAGKGKFMGKDELLANYTSAYRSINVLPVGSATILGVSKKQCATCHTHDSKLRGMGNEEVAESALDAGSTSTFYRTKYSAEFNLCVDCHSVKLNATWDTEAGYSAMGMFRYTLADDYKAANLIDAATGTYNFGKIFYHDGGSGTGRTFVDTHFGGTIASHLVNFDGKTTDVTLAGYNINPGNKNACTICHDPHTAGKLLDVPAGTTNPVDDNNNAAISFATGLGNFHTDYEADPFSRVNTGCTPCHNGSEFPRLTNGATIAGLGAPGWSVVGCRSCHDLTQNGEAVRQFQTGYQFKFNSTAAEVPVADLGDNGICFECHKGRNAGINVAAAADPAAGTTNYSISYLHYAPSMAIVYGDESKMVATYASKSYSGRFKHYDGAKFGCTDCHNVHTGKDVMETSASCNSCHAAGSAVSKTALKARTKAYSERLFAAIYDDMAAAYALKATDNARFLQFQEGTSQLATMPAGVMGLRSMLNYTFETLPLSYSGAELRTHQDEVLMTYIEERQTTFPNKTVAHAAVTWKVFTYEDGPVDGQAHGHGGSWAHNSRFARQMMFDAIESLGGSTTGLVRPAVLTAAAGPHEIAAAIAAENTAGSMASANVASNAVTAACSSCHNTVNFESSRHANQSARAAECSACHSHEGFVARSGKQTNTEELVAVFNATANPELFALPVAGTTFTGVTKKNCATCHDTTQNNKLRGIGNELVPETELIAGSTSTFYRTKYSAQFNLCTACHMVDLTETWEATEGYAGMGMYKYALSSNYAAEGLIPEGSSTYDFSKVFWHDGASGSGRTFVDTHFAGTVSSQLVNFDGTNTNVTVKGYNIDPGNADACTICHDPHTAGKMLAVAAGTTIAVDDNANAAISFASGLGDFHTDYLSDVFSRGSVVAQSADCATCHNGQVLAAKTQGITNTTTQKWKVVGCNTCHNLDKPNTVAAANDAAAFDDVRQFPVGYQFKFNSAAAAVPAADLGDNAICFECHKGRIAGIDVDALTQETQGTQNYTISYLHYAPSMAILYGNDSKMVATYAGKSYTGRFQHPVNVNGKKNLSCTDCHNVHTGGNGFAAGGSCVGCHDGVTAPTAATLKADVRAFSERLLDTVLTSFLAADGQANLNAACQTEIDAIQALTGEAQKERLMTYIETRQVYFPNKAIAQAAVAWKVFTYEDGPHDGQAHGHGGSWAHNGKFAKQVMYDAIQSLGGNVADLTRPTL